MLLGLGSSSNIPGLTTITPAAAGWSARLSNGVGFGRLGDASTTELVAGGGVVDPSTGMPTFDLASIGDLVQKGIVAFNAQQVFQLNLDRLQKGLPAIPTQYASPTVNVGLAGISPTMLILAAGVLLFLLTRKK